MKRVKKRKLNLKRLIMAIFILSFLLFIIIFIIVKIGKYKELKEYKLQQKKEKEYKTCLKKEFPESEYSSEFIQLKNDINDLFEDSSLNFSYYYEDINSGFSSSYNENKEIYTASIIKAPVVVYIYDLASQGKIDLSERLTYTSKYYIGGTGIIQDSGTNTSYSIKTLVEYSVKYSDNIAHYMLVDRFGMNNIKKYWDKLGNKAIFKNGELFPNMTAHDGYIVMKKLYDLYLENDYGKELMDFFKAARPFFVTAYGDEEVAHKYGWANDSLHDLAIAFNDKPYILIVYTKRGNASYSSFFKEISTKIEDYHNMYYSLKENYCRELQ